MLHRLFSDKIISKMTEKITQAVNESLDKYHNVSEQKIENILGHVESLRVELKSLDDRLTNKEVRDKSEYGHVQYKLSSLQSEILEKKRSIRPAKKTPDKLI